MKMEPDVIIIGAGAAGLMCAIEAGKRRRQVLVLERNASIGEKIRISGGGRCNFTNMEVTPPNYISQNHHFCKSALARYTQADFLSLVRSYKIPFHERNHGQLFCDESAEQLIHMLLTECQTSKIEIQTNCHVKKINRSQYFSVMTETASLEASSVVIATGGLSIPKLGATPFGFKVAEQFGLKIVPPKPGLVPLKFNSENFDAYKELSGIAIGAEVTYQQHSFRENILFTHRGLSGPAILQISSYWHDGDSISINLLPNMDALKVLSENAQSKKQISTILEQYLPSRFIKIWFEKHGGSRPMNQYSLSEIQRLAKMLTEWHLTPTGTEGYEKAEVTVGGIDTLELSSKTMEAKRVPGLYFIGEVVDVTGWLGGYNFQWAWSSGWAAGQVV